MRGNRRFFSLVIVVFALFATFPCSAFQNEPAGFREMKWGRSLNSIEGLIPYEPSLRKNEFYNWKEDGIGWADKFQDHSWKEPLMQEERKSYVLEEEDLEYEGADLVKIVYTFTGNKLSHVTLLFKTETDYNLLKEFCQRQYGERSPVKIVPTIASGGRHMTDTVWQGDITRVRLRWDHIFLTRKTFGYLQLNSAIHKD